MWIRSDDELLHTAHRLLMKLAIVSGVLPESLVIHGVNGVSKTAVCGGGFADIYRACHEGREVALKKFRVFQTRDRQALHRVCEISSH
jgi:hypothetical protein